MGQVIDDALLGELRPQLVRYSYRMLADGAAAEDAAQEVLLRLWATRDRYDPARGSTRTWAFAIATRHCLDLLRAAPRRALPTDFGPASTPGSPFGAVLPGPWVTPLPDQGDPAAAAESRESVRMAFVAALQRLSARQRAVLVLRDVYRFSSSETAELLDTGEAAVHSALQRARRAVTMPSDVSPPPVDERLLSDFVAAFERHDVALLTTLLHADVVSSMPPLAFWLSGRGDVTATFATGDGCVGHRLVPTSANGAPAFGQYAPDGAGHSPFALLVVEHDAVSITRLVTFLDQTHRFPAFGLPAALP